jgi:dinuclear metal center YbgI/SA1388 family protein
MIKVSDVVRVLEALAPPSLAADWDNVGLLVGDRAATVRKLLLCIDLTGEVLTEAAAGRAQMVMAYHPVIFKPISRVTADGAAVVYEAARRGISVYSMHTALDAAPGGTNDVLADAMGLDTRAPLEVSVDSGQCKVVVFCPPEEVSCVAEAAFAAGAGVVGNYRDCAFFSHGIGAFCGAPGTRPSVGHAGRHEVAEEVRLEIISPLSGAAGVCDAVRAVHSYETPAIDVYPLKEFPEGCGMGRIGRFKRAVTVAALIGRVKKATGAGRVLLAARPVPQKRASGGGGSTRSTARGAGRGALVSTAACCAGSCGSAWRVALAAGATFYLTGEMRHHEALSASRAGLTCACLGHWNSERLALRSVAGRMSKAMGKLRVAVSKRDRDPFEMV